MSGSNTTPQVLGTSTTVAGVATLPNTGGSSIGRVLAVSAIVIGVGAIVGQIVVRLVRSSVR